MKGSWDTEKTNINESPWGKTKLVTTEMGGVGGYPPPNKRRFFYKAGGRKGEKRQKHGLKCHAAKGRQQNQIGKLEENDL